MQLQKVCCCLQAARSGEAVVLAQGPCGRTWCNSLCSVGEPFTEFSGAKASVQFLGLAVL